METDPEHDAVRMRSAHGMSTEPLGMLLRARHSTDMYVDQQVKRLYHWPAAAAHATMWEGVHGLTGAFMLHMLIAGPAMSQIRYR